MSVFRNRLCLLLCLLLAPGLHAPGSAVSAAEIETGADGSIRLFDTDLSGAAPGWSTPRTLRADSEVRVHRRDDTILIQLIPKGTRFDDWGTLFGISAHRVPGVADDPMRYVQYIVGNYEATAGKENFALSLLARGPDFVVLMLALERTPNAAEQLEVYSDQIGQITLMRVTFVKDTVVNVYQAWRGPDFDRDKPESWPVGEAELKAMIGLFEGVRAVAADAGAQ